MIRCASRGWSAADIRAITCLQHCRSMVNRVLTSRYLWWFVPFPPRSKGDEWPLGVSASIVWL